VFVFWKDLELKVKKNFVTLYSNSTFSYSELTIYFTGNCELMFGVRRVWKLFEFCDLVVLVSSKIV
jgi:hypothetical protein